MQLMKPLLVFVTRRSNGDQNANGTNLFQRYIQLLARTKPMNVKKLAANKVPELKLPYKTPNIFPHALLYSSNKKLERIVTNPQNLRLPPQWAMNAYAIAQAKSSPSTSRKWMVLLVADRSVRSSKLSEFRGYLRQVRNQEKLQVVVREVKPSVAVKYKALAPLLKKAMGRPFVILSWLSQLNSKSNYLPMKTKIIDKPKDLKNFFTYLKLKQR